MEYARLTTDKIANIFNINNIANVSEVHFLDIGFTNHIYVINDQYILKVCVKEENEENFNRECFCYNLFKDKIPVPKIIVSDASKSLLDKYYMIYEKVSGDNLYSKWHLLNNEDRKDIVTQLCNIIKSINTTEYKSFADHFKVNKDINWNNLKCNSLKAKLNNIRLNKILENQFISKIEDYIENNHHTLFEEKIGLTYFDLHFDNVLVSGNKVTALLDFERTDILSIDYALDTIKRLSEVPYLYACEEYEKFIKKEDYTDLLQWFREFYPELFDFKYLDIRLALYSIEYDMRLLLKFPEAEGLKRRLGRTVGYDY